MMLLNKKHLIFSSLVAMAVLAGCGGHSDHAESEKHGAEADGHEHSEDEIVLHPEDAVRYGVAVEALEPAPFSAVVKTSGEIMPSAAGRRTVTASKAGIIALAKGITDGASVKAGSPVASISARNVSGGDSDRAALANLEGAKRELDRVEKLLGEGLVTRKEYNDALAAYDAAKALYSPSAASGHLSSPAAGTVGRILVSDGQYVEAGTPVAEILSDVNLTLRALLPASEADFLPLIKDAVISMHGAAPVRISAIGGRLASASCASAANIPGYIPVYFTFPNKISGIVPGTGVEVYLSAEPSGSVLAVPVGSIAEQMGEHFAFVKTSPHSYAKTHVKLGRSDGEKVMVLSGLHSGDSVVVSGTTFVRLAEQATVVPEGHSHNH
ncbi:MAG: efflux RND transporter periplasmic adaptor subunit [Duncaniella sp.]|nr:efflux RND transporter periplasmic adaptor subunit [Duncaniella sp.]